MGKFKVEAAYEERGQKAETGARDGARVVRVGGAECVVDYHVATRQIINPLNPYEICESEEALARSLAVMVAEQKAAAPDKGCA